MQAKGSRQAPITVRSRPHLVGKAHVFANAGGRCIRAIAVGHLIAEAGTQPAVRHCVCNHVKAAVDGGLAGVVVDQCRRAVADGVGQAYLGRGAYPVQVQCFIEFPPQRLQDLGEIFGRRAGDIHTACEGAVEVSVRTDLPRHEQHAVGIPPLVVRVAGEQLGAGADGVDRRAAVAYSAVAKNTVFVVKAHDCCVMYQHRGRSLCPVGG